MTRAAALSIGIGGNVVQRRPGESSLRDITVSASVAIFLENQST